jgi:UDPglucose--hexose-1-phosphate uridylyltransferase
MVNGGDHADRKHETSVLVDPTTGRPILMAHARQSRPFYTGAQAGEKPCPFCPGNEHETPPSIDSWPLDGEPGPAPAPRNEPGWDVRVFPNKYPANDCHEVIAEGSKHADQASDLDVATWRRTVRIWQRRIRAIEAMPTVGCAFLFKNVGAAAGASIVHSHSQILGLAEPPPRLLLEQQLANALPQCPWCRTIATAERDARVIFETDAHIVLTPDPPKLPNEVWTLPKRCDDDFLTTDADSLGATLHALFTAISCAMNRPAWNLWLHRIPRARFHWHFELQPRTGQLAGLELGGDMYINSISALASAQKLRNGLGAAPR